MTPLSQILENKIVAIIRGANPRDVLKIAMALNQGGVKILEITFNSQNALGVIEELANEIGGRMLIGAGTVLTAETAKLAIDKGARFIISPNTNTETIQMTKRYDAVSIPGAYTATEVVNAYNSGGDIIKVFPATNAEYIKVLRGPLSHIPMMPTGGINLENISEFQKAGAVAFGIGTSLVDAKREITKEYLEQITQNAHKFVQAVSSPDYF
jgi:2-dehydro-3-deoxyphosphogluconate aldolase/(4S)-4-hydroxy-2-oxoglutarate aldolase